MLLPLFLYPYFPLSGVLYPCPETGVAQPEQGVNTRTKYYTGEQGEYRRNSRRHTIIEGYSEQGGYSTMCISKGLKPSYSTLSSAQFTSQQIPVNTRQPLSQRVIKGNRCKPTFADYQIPLLIYLLAIRAIIYLYQYNSNITTNTTTKSLIRSLFLTIFVSVLGHVRRSTWA